MVSSLAGLNPCPPRNTLVVQCDGVQVIVCILGAVLRKCVMLIEIRDLEITFVSRVLFCLLNQQCVTWVRPSCDKVPRQLGSERASASCLLVL